MCMYIHRWDVYELYISHLFPHLLSRSRWDGSIYILRCVCTYTDDMCMNCTYLIYYLIYYRVVDEMCMYIHRCVCTANPTWDDIFESAKLKARTSLLPHFSEKRRWSFELWAFENDTPSGIGFIYQSLICRCTLWILAKNDVMKVCHARVYMMYLIVIINILHADVHHE